MTTTTTTTNITTDTMPFSRFERMLAFRYLRARRKEGLLSAVAILSFLGITLGVASLIIVMAVMNGFHKDLLGKIVGANGHLTVHKVGPLQEYDALAEKMRKVKGVNVVVPMVVGRAMIAANSASDGVIVKGMTAEQFTKLEKFSKNLKGSLEGFDKRSGIIIGSQMAKILNVGIGDKVKLITARGTATPFGVTPRVKAFKVAGVFEIGFNQFDRIFVIMPLKASQKYFTKTKPKRVDRIEVMVQDPENMDDIRIELGNIAGENFFMTTWGEDLKDFAGALELEKIVMFVILFMILIVAAFNIISGIIMLVKEKGRDIAVLRTMGATKGAVMRVFLITGASIGIAGTIAGVVIGVICCWNLDFIQTLFTFREDGCVINPKVYNLCKLSAELDNMQIAGTVGLSMVLSLLATLYPSWRAAQMDPVEALRYE